MAHFGEMSILQNQDLPKLNNKPALHEQLLGNQTKRLSPSIFQEKIATEVAPLSLNT